MNNKELTLQRIRDSFAFTDGGNIVDSFNYLWENSDGSKFEVYIHAPNRRIDPDQIKEFNLFMDNKTSIMTQIDSKMRELLHEMDTSENIIKESLQLSILSVMYQGKDFESKPCDYTIELICSKSYKTFFIKRSTDIVANIKQGQVLRIFDEIG